MLYKDIVEVNKNFQYSVNIEYDLFNENKVSEYIPTTDVCDVLKVYIKTVLGYTKNEKRASLLIGPYGKGKSFLILTLLRIICFNKTKSIDSLLDKIAKIDSELLKLIKEVYKRKIKLLPVIIDSNYYNIEQSFLMALNESLNSFGLNDIIPNTVYDVCLKIISDWENDKKTKKEVVDQCLQTNKISLSELKQSLKIFDKKSYYQFERLYNCVVKGVPFNPMINTDIVKLFADINRQLIEKGYSGIFIVYDEFSKTLESRNEFLSYDLKLIQDFAEFANRSSLNEQLHLCCITHKFLDQYQSTREDTLSSDFKKVSGRFKEIRFNRSLDQNYQIISFTLNKKANYIKVKDKYIKNNNWLYKELRNISFFEKDDENIVFDESFPMNPISVYAMIRLSEMIAQNERTMFTLISDNDQSSFNSFINNNSNGLYNVDQLYNYFSPLLKNEGSELKNLYLRCETAQKKLNNNFERNILKVLSVIYMINDFTKLPPTEEVISLCLDTKVDEIRNTINDLIQNKAILKKSSSSLYLDFAYNSSKEIDSEINKYLSTRGKNVLTSDILNEINNEKYIIPRKYNIEKQITRFFPFFFIEEEKYISLSSFLNAFDSRKNDGIVVGIINRKNSLNKIKKHFFEMSNNENVIVVVPNKYNKDIDFEAQQLSALNHLISRSDLSNDVIKQVELMSFEKSKELNELLIKCFKHSNVDIISNFDGKRIEDVASNICFSLYNRMPIINNEMLNKDNVSSQYKKARNIIINRILRKNTDYSDLSSTGPEMTVYNSFYSNNKLSSESEDVVKSIKSYITKKTKEKVCLDSIVSKLSEPPFGIRKGLIPMYLSIAISNMSDNTILYYENAELEINANNLDKICDFPSKYYIYVEKESIEQDIYLKKMLGIFSSEATDSYYQNTKLCAEQLKRWALGLPMIVKEASFDDNFLELDNKLIVLKDHLLKYDLNPHELVVKDIPGIFNHDLNKTVQFIKKNIKIDYIIDNYLRHLAKQITIKFSPKYKGSINGSIKNWEENNNIDYSNVVFEGKGNELYSYFKEMNHDDLTTVNNISSIVFGYRVSDWTSNNERRLLDAIEEYIENSLLSKTNIVDSGKNIEISALGETFKNNIESIIDEFSDSISNKEKIKILSDIICKYTGGKEK